MVVPNDNLKRASDRLRMLVVTKRHLTDRDIIKDQFGRYYELASGLVKLGWDVISYSLNYRGIASSEQTVAGDVEWNSYGAALGWWAWKRDLYDKGRVWSPHVVLASSDALHIKVGFDISRRLDIPLIVDLHDNLDSKGLTHIPGLRQGVRNAVGRAKLVTCVSRPLAEKIKREFPGIDTCIVIESAIPKIFVSQQYTRHSARRRFGIPENALVIGFAGALSRGRGLEIVLDGFRRLKRNNPDVMLVLAGPLGVRRTDVEEQGVKYLGRLDWRSVPEFLATLDVGVVPNQDAKFADYCYPQKTVEMCAMGVPLVAADFGVMRTMAAECPELLYDPSSSEDWVRAVRYQLSHSVKLASSIKSWEEQAEALDRVVRGRLRSHLADDGVLCSHALESRERRPDE